MAWLRDGTVLVYADKTGELLPSRTPRPLPDDWATVGGGKPCVQTATGLTTPTVP